MSKKSKLNKIIGLFLIFFPLNIQIYEPIIASNFLSNNFKKHSSQGNSNEDLKSEYLLGPGDGFYAEFIGLEIFSNKYI